MAAISGEMPSYDGLLRRVSDGTLTLTFILGLPRGGTTAIEKHLYSHLPFDANVNEPSLHLDIGTPAKTLEERADMTFYEVLKVVQQVESQVEAKGSRSLAEDPLRLVVKEVTNKVLPSMVPRWAALASAIVVIFREPSLQLESRLKSIVDRVKSGALTEFGITDDAPAATLVVHGQNLIVSGASKSQQGKEGQHFLSENRNLGHSFKSAWQDMVKGRDFSAMGNGLPRLSVLHPFCADKESQKVVWGEDAPYPAPGLAEFESLSDELCLRMLTWRLGWEPLRQQMQILEQEQHPHVLLLDFSCFQIAPVQLTAAVDRLHSECKGWIRAAQNLRLGRRAHDFELQTAGWEEQAWQAWYGIPCYGKVSRRAEVEPVLKAPTPASKFPSCCQTALRDALHIYSALASDAHAARPPANMFAPFAGIDPLFDELWEVTASDSSRARAIDNFMSGKAIEEERVKTVNSKVYGIDTAQSILSLIALACIQVLLLTQHSMLYLACRIRSRFGTPVESLGSKSTSNPADPYLVSVVIPCYNEETLIAKTLHSVRSADAASGHGPVQVEVIVALDKSSDDLTKTIVERIAASEDFPFPIRCVSSSGSGRGPTICAGIREARGHAMLFLHADCILPASWDTLATQALRREDTHAVAFRFQLGRERLADRLTGPWKRAQVLLLENAVSIRSSWLQVPFGDQAIVLRSDDLVSLGGFPVLPMFEDYSLVLRLLKEGGRTGRRICILEEPCASASRRFEEKGLWRTSTINFCAICAYFFGVPPTRIFHLYYGRSP